LRIWLYEEGSAPRLHLETVAQRLKAELPGAEIAIRGAFTTHHLGAAHREPERLDTLAQALASTRLNDPAIRLANGRPYWKEVVAERRLLENPALGSDGAIYSGYAFQEALQGLLPREESRRACLHIVPTDRLMVYWWEEDRCYYGSTVLCGNPAVISLSGCLEGPGVSEAFSAELRQLGPVTRSSPEFRALMARFRHTMLDYDDDRIRAVVTALAWQAVFYHFFGVAFCEDTGCRLYNSHWQDGLLAAVLPDGGKLCPAHAQLLQDRARV